MSKTKKTSKTKKASKSTKASKATNGNTVRVHYTGTLDDGTVFDSSRQREATLDFELGAQSLIPKFEEAIVGMKTGETKEFRIEAANAYGPPNPDAIVKVPKSAFPEGFSFVLGQPVQGQTQTGEPLRAVILAEEENEIVLDHNHPLAGKDLNFEVELVEIQ